MSDSHRWRGLVSVTAREGKGVFAVRTLAGEPPRSCPSPPGTAPWCCCRSTRASAELVDGLDGADLDDPARACVREIREGGSPAPAELAFDTDDDGEPQLVLYTVWDPRPCASWRGSPRAASRSATAASSAATPGPAPRCPPTPR